MGWKRLLILALVTVLTEAKKKCFAPGQGVDVGKRVRGATTVVHGAVTYVGTPDSDGLFNATILVRETYGKKHNDIKENVVIRVGPFGLDKACPKVKARMSYIFFIRNSGERKGKYRFFKTQLFPAYASEANLKIAEGILGTKETASSSSSKTQLPMKMESKQVLHSSQVAPKAQYNRAGCMELDAPANGKLKCLPNGRQCDFSCDEGYEMVGFYRKVCLGKQKGWKPVKPVQCLSSTAVDEEINQAAKTTPVPPGLSSSNLKKLFRPQLVNYNQKVLHSAFSTPEDAIKMETPRKLAVNLKSSNNLVGNAAKLAEERAQAALERHQALNAELTAAPKLDHYFRQFNSTACVEHNGIYEHGMKTSSGFSATAKVFTQEKISGKWILVLTFAAPVDQLILQNRQLYLIAHQSHDRRMFAIKSTISGPQFILPNMGLEIGFDAKFRSFAANDASVTLWTECDHFRPSIRNAFMKSTMRPYFGRNSFVRPTTPPTTAATVRQLHNINEAELYGKFEGLEVDMCSPYQPAGILPGTGQVRPRWISSVFKSAMRYDYNELMHKSLLFVQAQRSGRQSNNKYDLQAIPWRGDSGLKDGCLEGVNLEGGLYHDDGYVKHGLPTAAAVTVMLWGLVDYQKAYESTGELKFGRKQLRWALDYYMKAHTAKDELYVQVGDHELDAQYWGRSEEMAMDRPAAKISPERPGADIAGEIAAAFAAGSMVYSEEDPVYAAKCLQHARDLFDFAQTYQGSYSDHIETGEKYQKSTSRYEDELAWAAVWLYRATKDTYYLGQAEGIYREANFYSPKYFAWDDKRAGVMVLLARITGREVYKRDLNKFLTWTMNSAYRTNKGLVYIDEQGASRYAVNAALIALQASKVFPDYASTYETFAKTQINYLLGDSGRSFVVGFGINPPQRPYHRGSSCPDIGQQCSWRDAQDPRGNPQVLFGALVGGPNRYDVYEDTRNPKSNDVALDYTAGLMTAVAGLKESTQRTKNVRYFGRWSG